VSARRDAIRVLVIDDSAFSRQTITRILESSPLVEVVGVARDGEEALRRTLELEPEVITLDLEMPRMDGFTFLRLLMVKRPTPVIVVSGRMGEGDVWKALDLGAVDFVAKPGERASLDLEAIEEGLIRKVHAIRDLRIENVRDRILAAPPRLLEEPAAAPAPTGVVAIGSSTGGPAALMQTLAAFDRPLGCPILIAQHMPAGFTRGFAERLDRMTPFRVEEARGGLELGAGRVLIAPGGFDLTVERREGRVVARLTHSPKDSLYVPSVDRLFDSVSKVYGDRALAVVLTGMGDDGRQGAGQVKAVGGRVIAESEETAVIYGMPRQVIQAGLADEVVPLAEIPRAIRVGIRGFAASERSADDRGRES